MHLYSSSPSVASRTLPLAFLGGALALAGALVFPTHAAAQVAHTDSLADYAYNAAQGPRDKVVHYVKSNLDGSKRLVLSVHFAEPLKMEVLKVEADGRYLALVSAELDPTTLSESRMQSFNQLERGTPQMQMQLKSDPAARKLTAFVAKAEMPVTMAHLPAHIYNFDLNGLNATLPHLRDPKRDFEVGIVDPDFEFFAKRFKPDGGVQEGGFVYKGKATFKFLKEEPLDGVPCYRYEVGGPAFGGVTGSLWINVQDRLIQRFEHALPDNPDWTSFRLNRISARSMDMAGWKLFKEATIKRAAELRQAP